MIVTYRPQNNSANRLHWRGPDELARYLAAVENRWQGVLKKGVAKKIVWHRPDHRQTQWAVIYLHGFSASRQELAPIPERLADCLDANLFCTRLTGHGLPGHLLAKATLNDWLADAREALAIGRHIGKQVLIMGMSTGAALGVWLAGQSPDRVAALILISPNFGLRSWRARQLEKRWGRALLQPLANRERTWIPLNPRHGYYWTTRYPLRALFPMGELISLVRSQNPADIYQPVLTILSARDRIVSVRRAVKTHRRLQHARNRLVYMNESRDPQHHILGGDIISPDGNDRIVNEGIEFLDSVAV